MAAKTLDLMGSGLPPATARQIGHDPVAVTCAGTASTTATLITGRISNLTAASSQTGAILPAVSANANGANIGDVYFIANTSATTAVLYPPASATITGGASVSIAQNKSAIVWYYSTTVLFHVILA